MFRILGNRRRLCDGLSRRDWLHVGGLGFLGVGLSDYLRLKAAQAAPAGGSSLDATFGRAKRCILLLPYGSPPQHETFDPKLEAPEEIQGELKAIPTSVPGYAIGEYLPKIARVADRLTVIRSMTHPFPVHCTAYVTSGIPTYSPALESRPRDPKLWPYIGSVVDYVQGRRESTIPLVPRNMALPWKMNSRGGPKAAAVQAGPYAAFLGPAYDPVLTEFEGEGNRKIYKISPGGTPTGGKRHDVFDPYAGIKPDGRFTLAGAQRRDSVTLERQNNRNGLLARFDRARRELDRNAETQSFDRYQQLALSLVSTTRVHAALDIHQESEKLRQDYGMNLFGQSCLAARRLVEAGSRFVTVFWDEYAYLNTDWDTHWNHFYRLKDRLLPGFDLGFSALISDLEDRGMLEDTLVVWMSEHGRTPRFNKNVGRDHWSRVYSIAMAGAGVGGGNIIGESDRLGGDVRSQPVSPKDILATILHLLGIDAHTTIPDRQDRPVPVAGTGVVRPEIFRGA
ncbi:MAG: hypothetical protein CMJ65_14210 [Planctomycetaceae bacterium]|nr:hypothetical protein [Planctomycetaceae bacterium]MDP7274262.1 DUF1501 domain-containing protein [Planctomycetaceae bacterium]